MNYGMYFSEELQKQAGILDLIQKVRQNAPYLLNKARTASAPAINKVRQSLPYSTLGSGIYNIGGGVGSVGKKLSKIGDYAQGMGSNMFNMQAPFPVKPLPWL